jgi:beta-fructofuranosidase
MDSPVDRPSKSETGTFWNLREGLAGDPHRPLYHFVAPASWMNDPNGVFLWKEKYHLFYQYNPNGAFWGTIHWGHAVSADLVYWEDLPIALAPSKDGPDADGCWSGCVVNDRGVPTALYTGLEPQSVCLATGDDDLITWTKQEPPTIPKPPLLLTGFPSITGHLSADFRDPFVWRESNRWLMLIGTGLRKKGGTALLYESEDLRQWHYLRPVITASIGTDSNMWECPVLLRFDDCSVLLVCPHPEAKHIYWLVCEWENGQLHEDRRGKLDLGEYAYAPQCLNDVKRNRHLLWNWIKEGRSGAAQRSAGWSGVLSLPKECSINANRAVMIKPAAELVSLRGQIRSTENQRLTPSSQNPFLGFGGDCMEIEVELYFDEAAICALNVRACPDQTECTTIRYDSAGETLTLDGSQSSIDPDVDHPTVAAHLSPDHTGVVWFRVFVDRSVLEVFIADQVCITHRLYPKREDSVGLSFQVRKGSAVALRLAAWKLAPIWPDRATKVA